MIYTSMFLLFLVAIILLINHWNQHKGIVFLVFGVFMASIRILTFLLINIQTDFEVLALIFFHTDPLMCLIGPSLLFYFKSLIFPKMVFKPTMLLHFVPAIFVFINTFPYYFVPFADKVTFVTHLVLDEMADINYFHPLLFSFKFQKVIPPIISISYFSFFLFLGPKLMREGNVYVKKKVSLVINRMMIILTICIIPSLLLVAYSSYQASVNANEFTFAYVNIAFKKNSYFYLFTLILPLGFFLSPSMLFGDADNRNKLERIYNDIKVLFSSHNTVGPKTVPKSDDLDRILLFLEDSKPYLKDNFSLHDISRAINMPLVRVTNCFNKQLKISFPIYRNRLRVNYATSMLRDGAHLYMSIEGIAMKSGFKSISTFYMAFKSEYGVTPIEWIKKNL